MFSDYTDVRPIRHSRGESTLSLIAVVLHPDGNLRLIPPEDDDVGGGIKGPDPADKSIIKLAGGYCLNILGNEMKSGLKTWVGGTRGKTGGLGLSWHDRSYGIMAKLDPITLNPATDGSGYGVGIVTWLNYVPLILWIVSLLIFIFALALLALAIIFLFVPGT